MKGKRFLLPLLPVIIWALCESSALATSTCTTSSSVKTVQATICAPVASSSLTTTFHFSGASSSANGVRVSQIYIDGVKQADYFVPDVEVNLTLPAGSHRLTFQAIDNKNLIATTSETIAPHDSQVSLSWQPSGSAGVDSYIVWRSLRSEGGYAEAGTTATTSFVDKPGLGTFYYVVTAVSPKGESGYSAQVVATLK